MARPRIPDRPGRATDRVREYLVEHPSVRRALGLGLVNDAALARRIRPEGGTPLSLEAVAVALRRVERELPSWESSAEARPLLTGGSNLEIRTGYSMLRLPEEEAVLSALLAGPWGRGRRGLPGRVLVHVEEGSPHVSVTCPSEDVERVLRALPRSARAVATDHLALVVLDAQGAASNTPGVIAFLAELLAERDLTPKLLVAARHQVEIVAPDPIARRIFDLLHTLRGAETGASLGLPRPHGKESNARDARSGGRGTAVAEASEEVRSGAKIAREYVDGHPSVADCLAYGIVNVTALARRIGEEAGFTKSDAIEAALRRWKPERTSAPSVEARILAVVRESRLEVRTKVALVTAPPSWDLLKRLFGPPPGSPPNRRRLFQVLQGPTAVTVLCEDELVDSVLRAVGPRSTLTADRGLAAVIVHSPPTILETPGVLAFLSGSLYRAGINCLELMSLHLESTFVVRQPEALATFGVLSELVHPRAPE
jgi:hypothetical protein